jgi:predicted RNA binding protein YcfA (HicA-like mRNA interferase family)
MPSGLFNWTFGDVEHFLKENGFFLHYTNASHFYYTGYYKGILRNVCVPFHAQKSLKPRTLKGIIFQSGIPKEKWLNR